MKIFLLRHGAAVEQGVQSYPNDDRPLSAQGIKDMQAAAPVIAELAAEVDLILSSPLVRAVQTAKIAAAALRCGEILKTVDFLLPHLSPSQVLQNLAAFRLRKSLMLVGHEPQLTGVGSLLLGFEGPVFELKKGALCCIETDGLPPAEPGVLKWLLTSKQLGMMQA